MKKLTLIFTLLFTVLLSAPSYAKWTWLGDHKIGFTFYVDFERIRKVDGFVYFWTLTDYALPLQLVYLSNKFYIQGDCNNEMGLRYKILIANFYKEQMGNGNYITETNQGGWIYPDDYDYYEKPLQMVCNKVK